MWITLTEGSEGYIGSKSNGLSGGVVMYRVLVMIGCFFTVWGVSAGLQGRHVDTGIAMLLADDGSSGTSSKDKDSSGKDKSASKDEDKDGDSGGCVCPPGIENCVCSDGSMGKSGCGSTGGSDDGTSSDGSGTKDKDKSSSGGDEKDKDKSSSGDSEKDKSVSDDSEKDKDKSSSGDSEKDKASSGDVGKDTDGEMGTGGTSCEDSRIKASPREFRSILGR